MSRAKLNIYLIFLFFLAIWTGAGFYHTINSNYAWYSDPVGYAEFTSRADFHGFIPAWPILTALLILFSLTALIAFIPYKGPGRKTILTVLILTTFILIVTMAWFVPALNKLFGPDSKLSDVQIIELSRKWVVLNVIRQGILGALLWVGMRKLTGIRISN